MYNAMVDFLDHYPEIKTQWTWRGEIEDIGQIYLNADCVILPSAFEGLPNVICNNDSWMSGSSSNVSDIPYSLGKMREGFFRAPSHLISVAH